jgi:hypothetical protein
LSADTVKQLVALYPPARTRFHLGQPTPDAYGSALVEALRARGYALVEFKPGTAPQAGSAEAAAATAPGLNLHYLLDTAASPNLYRITVMVGQQSLSRAYWRRTTAWRRPVPGFARSDRRWLTK